MTRALRRAAFGVLLILMLLPRDVLLAAGRPVVFTSNDGTELAGMLYEASNRPAPGVILVHMLNRSKQDWAPFAERMQSAGATVLAIDLRGHGASQGSPALLPPMVSDVQAAVAWLAGRPGVRGDSLALVGASLGANLAAVVAADETAIRGVALISPSLDYRGVRIDPSVIKKLEDRPLWLVASTQDPYALRTLKELATGAAPREQRLHGAPAHGMNLLIADSEIGRSLVDWLQRTLLF